MEYIGDSAFAGNSRLIRVTLNEGLKRIEERAFASTVMHNYSSKHGREVKIEHIL